MQVRFEAVSKTIRKNEIIRDVSLCLNSGIISGIKGINGSGKTMMMRLIAGLIKPTRGRIYIENRQLWKDISFPESIGLLIENPAFLDYYSGFENLKILSQIKDKIAPEDIKRTIAAVGLNPEDKKKFKYYSLGMKQRLGIAAAVMEKPDIVLLDEPTNALDSDGIDMVKSILRKEKERGALIVLSCHDYTILRELSNEIYFLEEGVITGHKMADEVFAEKESL